jgi:hypothetical protein
MPKVALTAHYDGERILLDEPFPLPKDAKLLVVLITEPLESQNWAEPSRAALARAYSVEEPEYSAHDVRP